MKIHMIERYAVGKEAYVICSDQIELSVTRQGGQMAPVLFYRKDEKPVSPYFISPWQYGGEEPGHPSQKPLRGDFFCMPCGLSSQHREEGYTLHGETSGKTWDMHSYRQREDFVELVLHMNTTVRKASVKKSICLKKGQNVVYISHRITGDIGNISLGHHAMLRLQEEQDSLLLSTSPIRFGYTLPVHSAGYFNNGVYSSLKAGQRFTELCKVPSIWQDKPSIDCSSHPVTTGFTDMLQLYNAKGREPGWVTAYYPQENYLWFALKNTEQLPSTVLWMQNKGSHPPPYCGKVRCLGIEDMCAAIGDDNNAAIRKELDREKVLYEHRITMDYPLTVNYIQGIQKVEKNFGRVKDILFRDNSIRIVSESGKGTEVSVDWNYITTGYLKPPEVRAIDFMNGEGDANGKIYEYI